VTELRLGGKTFVPRRIEREGASVFVQLSDADANIVVNELAWHVGKPFELVEDGATAEYWGVQPYIQADDWSVKGLYLTQ
jgi:hypothetical protein